MVPCGERSVTERAITNELTDALPTAAIQPVSARVTVHRVEV